MKKRNQRLHDYQTMGKKVLCGKFAQKLKNNFAIGDEQNNLILYNITSPKPITVLNPQINNSVSSLTALTFTLSDDQVIVGSSRGSINVWDLNALRINFCLKGHTVQVCSLYADKKSENIIVSGSSDTNAKVWDLRTRNCQHNIKNHNKKINALTIGTQSRLLVTGGEDGIVQTFDLRMMRPIFQYDVQSPILCAETNINNKLAIGCMDRLARVYNCYGPFNLVGCTKNDTMPVSSVVFHKDNFLFTAGTDNLKAYSLFQEELIMTDNIQTNSKGILQMVVGDNKLQQIAYSGGTLSYHQCFLSQINFQGPYVYANHSISIEKTQKVDEAIEKNNKVSKPYSNPFNHITSEKTKNMIANRSSSIAKQLSGVAENITDVLVNIKKVSQQFSNKKVESSQLKEMMEDHSKFLKVMGQRAKMIQMMLDLWMRGNLKMLIQQLKTVDLYVVADVLSQILKPSKISISAQFGVIIAERSKEMINNKHLTIIKMGIQYMLQTVSLFKDDMIKMKTFGSDKGVDLAREERLKRYDQLIEQFIEVYQSHRLKKLAEKKDQTSKLAQKLTNEFTLIFKKVYGNQYEP